MPNAKRRPDDEIHQEWATDTSADGKPSGDLALEVIFDEDSPDSKWTTHIYRLDDPDKRLSRGDKTAIVIEGLDQTRERALTTLLNDEGEGSSTRSKILSLLAQDPDLRWAAKQYFGFCFIA